MCLRDILCTWCGGPARVKSSAVDRAQALDQRGDRKASTRIAARCHRAPGVVKMGQPQVLVPGVSEFLTFGPGMSPGRPRRTHARLAAASWWRVCAWGCTPRRRSVQTIHPAARPRYRRTGPTARPRWPAPAWIGVGTLGLFHGEDITYAKRLTDSGVPCTLEVVPGAIHGFDDFLPHANISRTFFESQCTSLREALNPEAARE